MAPETLRYAGFTVEKFKRAQQIAMMQNKDYMREQVLV